MAGLVEILGFLLVTVGAGLVVAAAYAVSLPLALLAAGLLVVFIGIAVVYVANTHVRGSR